MATEQELLARYDDFYWREDNFYAQSTLSELDEDDKKKQKLAFAEIITEMTIFGPPEAKQAALLKMEMSDELRTLLGRLIQEEYIRTFSDPAQWGDFTKDQRQQVKEILDDIEENCTLPPDEETWAALFGERFTQPLLDLLDHLADSRYIQCTFAKEDLVMNGIRADTGSYAIPPMKPEELASRIKGEPSKEPEKRIPEALAEEHKELTGMGVKAKKIFLYDWTPEREAALMDASKAQVETLLNRLSPLEGLGSGPLDCLMANFNVARREFFLGLNAEQMGLLVELFNRPSKRDKLVDGLHEAFKDLEPDQFIAVFDESMRIFDRYTEDYLAALRASVETEQQVMVDAMLEELHTFYNEQKGEAELEEKHSFAISFADTNQVSPLLAFPTPSGIDPTKLDQAGWGIIFPTAMPEEKRERIKLALKELLDLRKAQAGPLFRIYEGPAGYREGDTKSSFLQRHRVGSGLVIPKDMPFYILLIGSPEEIPYDFEDQLDVMRGVGRLDFGEDYAAYAQYAHNVVLAESGQVKLPRKGAFFSVANPGDKATQLSARYLIRPLQKNLSGAGEDYGMSLRYAWEWETMDRRDATHKRLFQVLGGDPEQVPAFLITASHGMEFPKGSPDQEKFQGALLCQDWPGPRGQLAREHYFAGEDLAPDANVLGMVAVFFACYGAGTPRYDQFAMQKDQPPEEIAPRGAFVADLPKQLLKHGALAVLGHVERAWGYSFIMAGGEVDNAHFVVALRRILNGEQIGFATDPGFDLRYADKSSELSNILGDLKQGHQSISDAELVQLWTASNDARGYAVIGDPAARIVFAKDDERPDAQRPALITEVDWDAYVNHLQAHYDAMPDGSDINDDEEDAERRKRELKAAKDKYGALVRRHREIFLERKGDDSQDSVPAIDQSTDTSESSATEVDEQKEPPPDKTAKASAVDEEPEKESSPTEDEEPDIVPDPNKNFAPQIADLETSLKKFSNQIAQAVKDATDDIITLDVETYSTDNLSAIQRGNTSDRKLRAFTRVRFDGDMENYVPTGTGGGVDQELWQIHMDMVREAQVNRAQFLQAMAEMATNLLKSLKP